MSLADNDMDIVRQSGIELDKDYAFRGLVRKFASMRTNRNIYCLNR